MKRTAYTIARSIVWVLGILIIARIFAVPAQPFTAESAIEDLYQEHTPALYAGDVFSQTFLLSCGTLESIAVAFSYEQTSAEDSSLSIQLYRNDALMVEQPLPLSACPNGEFLPLGFGKQDFSGDTLTVVVTNTSADPEAAFSLLATTDPARYQNYTEGYTVNGTEQTGSIFCRFRYLDYLTDHIIYQKLTKMFLVLLVTLLLSGAIGRLAAWQRQRTPRSRG